ncbi:MAG: long-chain-fatty-acid--CoA ligase [Pseudomonadota bacterium]
MQTRHYKVWPEGKPYSLPPAEHSVYQNLVDAAAAWPDRPAIVYYGKALSYREMLDQVRKIAGYLAGPMGVDANDRVALYMQNAPQFVISYYAILAANAVIVPVNPMLKGGELGHLIRDSGANAIIYGDERAGEVHSVWEECNRPALLCAHYRDYIDPETDLELPRELEREPATVAASRAIWADALRSDHPAPVHDRAPTDWCIIPYSSGTTGEPKGCLHTHASVNATARAYPDWVDMCPGSRVLATLPFCHVTGMQHSMNLPILTGSTIYLMTRWHAGTAARLLEEERIQHWRSITTMMIDFLSLPEVGRVDLSALQAVGGGGAQMPEAVAAKMAELIGLEYVEAYGLTETCAPTHINPPAAPKKQCLGIPIFDVDSRIVDPETFEELGPNQQGEIVTHAPQLFQGYWRRPEETEAVLLELDGKRFFRTGDLGYYDDDGYFFFVDRLKRMINVSGLKVWPAEVEAILHRHPAVSEACVVGDPDPRTGEAVRAVIVLSPDVNPPSIDDLICWCQENMAAYKVPSSFEFRDTLPRSSAGKVLWRSI